MATRDLGGVAWLMTAPRRGWCVLAPASGHGSWTVTRRLAAVVLQFHRRGILGREPLPVRYDGVAGLMDLKV